jgi:KDO2-lipid IV(A) lauroyltransferase
MTGTAWRRIAGGARVEHALWASVIWAIDVGTRRVPWRARPALGRRIGDLAYRSLRRQREIALRNLAAAYPEWSQDEVQRVARACFRNLGQNLMEFLALPGLSTAQLRALVRLDGMEHVRAALADGGGAILLTAHYGNWEFAAARLAGEGVRVNIIGRLPSNRHVSRFITRIREQKGYTILPRHRTLTPYIERLRQNELVTLLTDANNYSGDLFVPFFGRPAVVPRGAAVLALRSGRPVLPVFIARQPDETHHMVISPPIARPPGRDVKRAVEVWMTEMTALIEQRIRQDPTQWLWIHDRWKRTPPEPDALEETLGEASGP